ncbi:MAG: oligopeptidase A [Methylotenera sp. 24-45-7]|nr:MAG: oligopeptidase A [Mehylophilales bacterium 35-46-6]OYZ40970.1 MAG: oligopeptidase A [Methylotenera sp. 24-45-7]OZA08205.1 MAG: oligopeptidase A [Methylotenera sp. 17-45-7]OZA53937.1 MAG: oligopeptidase A [Methylophilales bacterium 39-45-7]HQS37424.1 M3 family metallopeptidase [Methylotenera sp.]
MSLENNPLLHFSGLPKFNELKPEHVSPAIDYLLVNARQTIETLATSTETVTWENYASKLEDIEERLSRAWSQVGHVNAVVNSPEMREAYNDNLSKLTDFYADLSQDERLYAKYRTLRNSQQFDALTDTQKKIVENELRDFRLGGAELPLQQKARFKEIQEELSKLSSKFEENVLDNTNDYALYMHDAEALKGIPADVLEAAADAAKAEDKTGWKFTLHFPSYLPVLQYADNRELRETLYRAYATRASEFSKPEWDNTPIIAQILKLRHEAAQLLGFDNYAELSVATKMADSAQHVKTFLQDLAAKAKPFALRDKIELEEYAAKLGITDMQAWDVSYVSEKLREDKYAFSDLEVKQYFPESKVLAGLFRVVETIFGIHVNKSSAPVWHQDASFYDIKDHQGELIGQFYLDLYARNNKRGGAWMDEAITRRKSAGGITKPVAYLTCNFSAPVGDKPALFTHDEVLTMFHEFGHGLHHMLTEVDDYSVSGIKGVEWDAVELPSQFMENFCWEWEVLRHMTAHVETGEQLPRALFDKMVAAKNFQAGMQTVRQIEFSLFDIRLHSEFDPHGTTTALDLIEQVRDEVAVVRPPKWNRFPHNFTHVFSGGYAAGYYSYKWAEVLSADAYSMFEEDGVLSREAGQRYWQEILAKGGSRSAMESFAAFRGREPNIDALLRHNGMTA